MSEIDLGQGATYDPSTDRGMVRFHLNDTSSPAVFTDDEVDAVLASEGGVVKLAAATMILANASNEALASKVLRTQDRSVDGAKLSDALRAHAAELRRQHYEDDEGGEFFDVIDFAGPGDCGPELAPRPVASWPSYPWSW